MDGSPDSSSGEAFPPSMPQVDLSRPRYDQSTYSGRAKHFIGTANPLNALVGSKRLQEAAQLVKDYKSGHAPPGTTEDQLWEAKRLYDSAYHPDTGEKMFLAGRMSFQVPGNMVITGCVLTFYKHPAAVIFWQFANQTFNSVANYTNRSGNEVISPWSNQVLQVLVPYFAASSTATATALFLNKRVAKRVPPMVGRLIPFVAIAAANCINIPLMRQKEFRTGVPIYDQDQNQLGMSKAAARKGIAQVVVSRILMAVPAMVIPPIIVNSMEKKGFLKRFPWTTAPIQMLLVGCCLTFATPLCCALFPQKSSISVSKLEKEVQESIQQTHAYASVNTVYFNKGL